MKDSARKVGDRVWTIDARWGTVCREADSTGWFTVRYDDGREAALNADRVSDVQTPGIRSADGSTKVGSGVNVRKTEPRWYGN